MANIATPTTVTPYQFSVKLNDTNAQNLLANKASSGVEIAWSIDAWNIDGTNAADLTIEIYDQDGTAICSNTGTGEATTATDTVAGSGLGGPTTIPIAADGGIQEVAKGYLNEDQSVVATASNGNDIAIWIKYTVIS